jgi:predicted dienelactone hydrolase
MDLRAVRCGGRAAAGAIGAVALLACGQPRAAEQQIEIAGLHVTVWSPSQDSGKAPTLVFSHGFHGCATQSRFLMEALASAGYLVLAPNHRDATCNSGTAQWLERPTAPFGQPDTWNDTVYRDRADDVRNLVAALGTDERFRGRADLKRLGLVGHSLGGYTVLGLAGAWPSWKLDGVKAVLALSPYTNPFIASKALARLAAPVMYQGGTWDYGITPTVSREGGSYDLSPAPKFFVEFTSAGHFVWTDLRTTDHDGIVAYGIAFLDRYVKGGPAEPSLTRTTPEVARLRYSADGVVGELP